MNSETMQRLLDRSSHTPKMSERQQVENLMRGIWEIEEIMIEEDPDAYLRDVCGYTDEEIARLDADAKALFERFQLQKS